MLQTFDKSVPEWEQRSRVADMKRKGHKHGTKRRSWKVKEKLRSVAKHKQMLREKYVSKVREFWRGEREAYPSA